jgi:hypothetical protein
MGGFREDLNTGCFATPALMVPVASSSPYSGCMYDVPSSQPAFPSKKSPQPIVFVHLKRWSDDICRAKVWDEGMSEIPVNMSVMDG